MGTSTFKSSTVRASVRGAIGTAVAVPLLFSAMPAMAQSQQEQMQQLRDQIQQMQQRFDELQAQQVRACDGMGDASWKPPVLPHGRPPVP